MVAATARPSERLKWIEYLVRWYPVRAMITNVPLMVGENFGTVVIPKRYHNTYLFSANTLIEILENAKTTFFASLAFCKENVHKAFSQYHLIRCLFSKKTKCSFHLKNKLGYSKMAARDCHWSIVAHFSGAHASVCMLGNSLYQIRCYFYKK